MDFGPGFKAHQLVTWATWADQDMPGLAVGDAVLINQTRRETMIICQPQQRNTAGRIFGGYLMRPGKAMENPWGRWEHQGWMRAGLTGEYCCISWFVCSFGEMVWNLYD